MSCGCKHEPNTQENNIPVTLHKKKTEKETNIKESFCGSEIDEYGEERSAKDIAMLKAFGCRK